MGADIIDDVDLYNVIIDIQCILEYGFFCHILFYSLKNSRMSAFNDITILA